MEIIQFVLDISYIMTSLRCVVRPSALAMRVAAPRRCQQTTPQICLLGAKPATSYAPYRCFATTKIRLSAKKKDDGSKLFATADLAVADVKSGSTILSSGFGLCGVAGMNRPDAVPHKPILMLFFIQILLLLR
jgi:3-oxoacid CoA-transferase